MKDAISDLNFQDIRLLEKTNYHLNTENVQMWLYGMILITTKVAWKKSLKVIKTMHCTLFVIVSVSLKDFIGVHNKDLLLTRK